MKPYIIGFTGSRDGMTDQQKTNVMKSVALVRKAKERVCVVHGDCIGADADFHHICLAFEVLIYIRPCTFENMRAYSKNVKTEYPPERPMARNRKIVADANIMFACPPNMEVIKSGSGTWATIGFARKANKPLLIFYPDGSFDSENL